jgi:hypothetical protein
VWGDAFAELSAAHRDGQLDLADLERLAVAAYMVGRDDACDEAWIAAHHAWLQRGDAAGAARCAFGHAIGLFFRGDLAPATGWVARGGSLLEASRRDCVEHAWLRMLTTLPRLFEGDADVYASFPEAGEIAERFADADAAMFARLCSGYALILDGRVSEGVVLLDEVMVSVTADEVAPMLAGIAYCQVIALCESVFDLRRARDGRRRSLAGAMRSPASFPSAGIVSSIAARSFGCMARGRTPSIPPAERANCSPVRPHGTPSDRPTTSWPRSSGCEASSRMHRSRTEAPAWRDTTPSPECRCSAWRRDGSISLCPRSAARWRRRRIRSHVTDGLLGSFAFDRNGNPTRAPIGVFRLHFQAAVQDVSRAPFPGAVLDRVITPPAHLLD